MKPAKNRTKVLLKAPVSAVAAERKFHESAFLITINANERANNIESPESKLMIARLKALGDYLLKKKNILAGLKFLDKKPKNGELQVTHDREWHLNQIISISKDRSASIEIGSKFSYIHLHLHFEIKHRTYIQLRREFYGGIASRFLGKPEKNIHLHFNGKSVAHGYGDYVNKNASEDVPLKTDKFVSEFYSDRDDATQEE